jgi:histone-lysine N-methyltransferase SETMAR
MEQRAVIRFLTLKGLKSSQILIELTNVYHEAALSLTAVKKWHYRFKDGRTTLDDNFRAGRPKKSDLAEPVQFLINEFPFISCKCICTKLRIAKTTCLRVLHDDLGLQKFNCRWIPHTLSQEQFQERVDVSEELLRMLQLIGEDHFNTVITGDESWFFYSYPETTAWAPTRNDLLKRENLNFRAKKCLISIFWSPAGISSLLAVPKGTTYDSSFFCTNVLADIFQQSSSHSRQKSLRGLSLHFDNARPHVSKVSILALRETKANHLPHPAYSPDLAPSDFFLFGYLKGAMAGRACTSENDLLSTIRAIFNEIPKETLTKVYREWMIRLSWVIQHNGQYYSTVQ